MGTSPQMEIDAWLREGGIVITASDRAARALAAAYHRARRAEGFDAWPAPDLRAWQSFARDAWADRSTQVRLVLNSTQETHLWAEIAAREDHPATVLDNPRLRIAALALGAQDLLATRTPRFLNAGARANWQQDAAAFSKWLSAFERLCLDSNLMSASRVPLELATLLENDDSERPPLLLAGFDRILPVQRRVFDAWGSWHEAAHGETAADVQFFKAADSRVELAACALWCKRRLLHDPAARLLIVAQDVAGCRGQLERALLRHLGAGAAQLFEFSLGIQLSQTSIARAALLALRWLAGLLEEAEVDWLIASGLTAANADETAWLLRAMRTVRRHGLERTAWTLDAFCRVASPPGMGAAAWSQRMMEAKRRLAVAGGRTRSPFDWAALAQELLETIHWPGFAPLASAGFQAANRWEQAMDSCCSLGFDGRRMEWREFVDALARAADETLFVPESHDAPIQIAGPAESAGLQADAIWFLGTDEDAWPASGSAHPFLPMQVQREGAMPHAAPHLDWELAHTITARLLASACEVRFSYSGQTEGVETRPSRVVRQLACEPEPLPSELTPARGAARSTTSFADESRIPFLLDAIEGGAAVFTAQSQCAFKAFATARLAAKGWEPAQAGLTPAQRGNLVHEVLHAVWGGPPAGIRTLEELRALTDLDAFVAGHVKRVMRKEIPQGLRERMPQRYLALEASRLARLICVWLNFELTRQPFAVVDTEVKRTAAIEGLMLKLRLDRIDRLNDGTLLVIDYKTGDVKPSVWDLPRPDDVQLPLYAGFALDPVAEPLGGLVFAKVHAGKDGTEFAGRVRDAARTLLHDVGGRKNIAKNPLTDDQLCDWSDYIQKIARDFLAGHAFIDPRDYPKTCGQCGLQALCRIEENRIAPELDEDSEADEAGDE